MTVSPSNTQSKSILITGCSTGIGYHTAKGLSQRGYQVYATVRNEADRERLTAEGITAFIMDYGDSSSIQQTVEQLLSVTQGELFALFNNGAYGQPGALEDLSRDALRAQFEANVFGWQELINLLLPTMRRQGYGRILQNSSVLGLIALKYRGAYNASKYAIEGLSDTLRLELAGSNIFVSLIEPGPIESQFRVNALKMFRKNINPELSAHSDAYKKVLDRLTSEDHVDPFTLPPEAVLKRVIWALESSTPAARYPVTTPTYLLGGLKRVLPTRWLDQVLLKI